MLLTADSGAAAPRASRFGVHFLSAVLPAPLPRPTSASTCATRREQDQRHHQQHRGKRAIGAWALAAFISAFYRCGASTRWRPSALFTRRALLRRAATSRRKARLIGCSSACCLRLGLSCCGSVQPPTAARVAAHCRWARMQADAACGHSMSRRAPLRRLRKSGMGEPRSMTAAQYGCSAVRLSSNGKCVPIHQRRRHAEQPRRRRRPARSSTRSFGQLPNDDGWRLQYRQPRGGPPPQEDGGADAAARRPPGCAQPYGGRCNRRRRRRLSMRRRHPSRRRREWIARDDHSMKPHAASAASERAPCAAVPVRSP